MGLSSFLGLFGPLPLGLVLGISSFWPVMNLNIDLNHKGNLYLGDANKNLIFTCDWASSLALKVTSVCVLSAPPQ